MGFLVGLDCGGAKTAGVVCDGAGKIVARARGPGSAIVGLPGESFFAVVAPVLKDLFEAAGLAQGDVKRFAIGLSGVDFVDEAAAQAEHIAGRLGLGDRLVLVNDGLIALWGASASARVVLVQHGSGITTAYRRAVGDEEIFDSLDVAHVFDLRRAAVARTARMIDGREPVTSLKERVLAHCGVDEGHFAEWFFRDPQARPRCATLAAVVFDAWRNEDPVATELVEAAANDYVLTAQTMGRKLSAGAFDACFAGGVILQGGEPFRTLLTRKMKRAAPQAHCIEAALPPELGAVVLARWSAAGEARALHDQLAEQLLNERARA